MAAEIDGQRVFLDPSDRALGFGQLQASYEGTPAVLYDRKKPVRVRTKILTEEGKSRGEVSVGGLRKSLPGCHIPSSGIRIS